MKLSDLKPSIGSTKKSKRVGRGRSSGHGKTSTLGHNGQGQRSGEARRFGFEGGQTPLFRRLPKIHNFDQVKRRDWIIVNLEKLNNLPDNFEVTPWTLVEQGIVRKESDSLRILGKGELTKKLIVKCHHVSANAKAAIEKLGGSVELITNS